MVCSSGSTMFEDIGQASKSENKELEPDSMIGFPFKDDLFNQSAVSWKTLEDIHESADRSNSNGNIASQMAAMHQHSMEFGSPFGLDGHYTSNNDNQYDRYNVGSNTTQ